MFRYIDNVGNAGYEPEFQDASYVMLFGSYNIKVVWLDLIHILQTTTPKQKSIIKTLCWS